MMRKMHRGILFFVLTSAMGSMLMVLSVSANSGVLSSDTLNALNPDKLSGLISLKKEPALIVNESEVRAGMLFDVENKQVIWQKNMHNAYPIASLTKMMVALLAVEDVRKGIVTWEDKVQWTRIEYRGRGKNRRKVSSTVNYTLRDLFKASMIASNNECSEQMARYLGKGDLPAAIARMNARARELGMQNTFYGNPTGLPASKWMNDNTSTPIDQLLLTLEMLKYQEILEIAGMGYASIENGKATSVIRNHNRLTIDYSGEVDGLKTGYTKRAGFCLVATTAKCDHRIVGILFGCRGPQIRNDIMRDLFNDYYTSIGLDKLGPYCENPMAEKTEVKSPANGEMVTVKEKVRKTHHVRSGESLSLIAAKYRCSVQDLKKWNSKISSTNRIYAGQTLTVYNHVERKVFIKQPANGSELEDDNTLVENPPAAVDNNKTATASASPKKVNPAPKQNPPVTTTQANAAKTGYVYHTVMPGDTLTSIAKKYEGTTVEELKRINRITDARNIRPGMKIKVLVQG